MPRLVINAKVPSGIVDTLEFWITFDVTVPADSARTYIQIGSFSKPDGQLLTENEVINFTYSNLGRSDFFVKVRGVNNLTSGPYSDPSGLIAYIPIVVADQITDNPMSIGGQIMTLGALTLLNNLDELLKVFNGEKGIADAIKEIFFPGSDPDKTVKEIISSDPDIISGIGEQTLDLSTKSINELGDVDTITRLPVNNSVLFWDGSNWIPGTIGVPITPVPTPAPPPGPPTPVPPPAPPAFLIRSATFPPDGSAWLEPTIPEPSNQAPTTGPYFVYFRHQTEGVYFPMSKGTGNIRLYKSDGTLVETVSAAACTIGNRRLSIPFAPREPGTDYYILMDEGIVEYCASRSPAITSPTVWNFNTPPVLLDAYNPDDVPLDELEEPSGATPPGTMTVSASSCNDTITFAFSEPMILGSGSVTLSPGNISIPISNGSFTTGNRFFTLPVSVSPGVTYNATIPAGLFETNRSPISYSACGISGSVPREQWTSNATTVTWTVASVPTVISYQVESIDQVYPDPFVNVGSNRTGISPQTNIKIRFNMSIAKTSTPPGTITIFRENGSIHQVIDTDDTFAAQKTSDLWTISGDTLSINPTVDLDPGETYYVNIAPNTFANSSCLTKTHAGLTDSNSVRFTTRAAPQIVNTIPAAGSSSNVGETVEVTFDGPIVIGASRLRVVNADTNAEIANVVLTKDLVSIE